jgi:hypothetical protein
MYIEGFTSTKSKQPVIPNELFFAGETQVDLNKDCGTSNKKYNVRGLIKILSQYNFTIDENDPNDTEVALDPELLGKVFENLLASYNPETASTARKSTGSYYTPREIVEYMVNESILAYLKTTLPDNIEEDKLRYLLDYNSDVNPFEDDKKTTLKIIDAVEKIKILDPACGSGAFPIGVLHKLVLILHKLDPENKIWKQRLLDKVPTELREETEKSLQNKSLDYIRKLGLIEHCIYGVDIQEIAIQISKLRFFISLLVEQEPDDTKPNRDIRALPNLETKFVAANTLIGLEKLPEDLLNAEVSEIIKELFEVRKDFFYVNSREEKKKLEEKDEKLKKNLIIAMQKNLQKVNNEKIHRLKQEIEQLTTELQKLSKQPDEIVTIETTDLFGHKEVKTVNKTQQKRQEIKRKLTSCQSELNKLERPHKEPAIEIAEKIVEFNPYDQNKSNSWFDPEWMFGITDGFDIVIGNPPYGNLLKQEEKKIIEKEYKFSTTSDISSPFIERGFNSLKNQGNLIFIITYAITFSKDFSKSRELIANGFKENYIFTFDRDRCRIFESMTQTVSIIKCFNKNAPDKKGIWTSRMFRETPDINKIELTNCNQYLMPKGSGYNQKHRLPKIGEEINRQILDKLLQFNDNVGSIIKNSGSKIWIRTSGNYWYNAFDRKPYEGFAIAPLYVDKNFANFFIVMMNSSLFYFWFRMYGDGHNMNIDILESFPLPNREKILKYNILLNKMKERFMNKLFSVFEKERNRFITSSIKSEIDLLDLILGKYFYNLDYNEIVHILNYDFEIRGGNKLEQPFIDLVDKILSAKKQNPQAETSQWDGEIDQLVYKLYELTPEEVKIIEGGK